jgi:threonine/homoserine/homoserine lactone efflux protein
VEPPSVAAGHTCAVLGAVLVFYLTVMPQFLPDGVPALLGSFVLGLTHVVEGVLWLSALVLAVGRASGWLTRPRVRRRLDQLCGAVFVGFGLGLAFDRGLR